MMGGLSRAGHLATIAVEVESPSDPKSRTAGRGARHSGRVPPRLDAVVRVRPRNVADLPVLEAVLRAQQPESAYPVPWPLPGPVDQFIARDHELASWVALRDEIPVGHVAIQSVAEAHGLPTYEDQTRTGHETVDAWCRGHRRPVAELAAVVTLFVAPTARRTGVGATLLDTAVRWMSRHGYAPCLEVLPQHGRAVALYQRTGWHTVAHVRPGWLPASYPPALAMVRPDADATRSDPRGAVPDRPPLRGVHGA